MKIVKGIVIILNIALSYTAAISVLRDQHTIEKRENSYELIRRSSSNQSIKKSELSQKGKQIENKIMKEPKQLRTPQLRQTLIEQELTKQSEKAKKSGMEKANFQQKVDQRNHSSNSWKGKALSFLPFTAENKLKKANNQIRKANSAFQNLSKDLNYHQRQGHIHDMSSITKTVQEIQQGGKTRFSNRGQSSNSHQQGSHQVPRVSHSLPTSRATSPNRPLLASSNLAGNLVTPNRSPTRNWSKTPAQSQSHSHSSSPHRSQMPRRG